MSHEWDDLRDAMTGRATEDTRARASASLQSEVSTLRKFSDGCRDVSVPLFGATPPAIVVSPVWFHISYAVFWLFWYSICVLWHCSYPVQLAPVVMYSGIALSILVSVWFCIILHRNLSKQLIYSGPGVRGTLNEAITGAAFGTAFWWLLSLLGIIEGVFSSSLRGSRAALIIIASAPALYGLTMGFGFRERVAQSTASLPQLLSVGLRRFVIIWPWLAGVGWLSGYLIRHTTAPLALGDLHLEATLVGILIATCACLLMSAQLCMCESQMKGTLKDAVSAMLLFVSVIGVGAVPLLLATRWAFDSNEILRVSVRAILIVLLYGAYCGFGLGATEHNVEWGYIRGRLRIFAIASVAGTVAALIAATAIDFLFVGWGRAVRPIALLCAMLIFVRVFDSVEQPLLRHMPSRGTHDLEGVHNGLHNAIGHSLVDGPHAIVEYLRCVTESFRAKRRWQMAP